MKRQYYALIAALVCVVTGFICSRAWSQPDPGSQIGRFQLVVVEQRNDDTMLLKLDTATGRLLFRPATGLGVTRGWQEVQ